MSNPLPPPTKPRAVPETPRTNADFRALLATPRAERGVPEFRGGDLTKDQTKKEKKAKKPYTPKTEEKEEGAEDEGPQYRDRAEERRKGVNPDYDGFNADVNTLSGQTAVPGGNLTIDESKFLGGDVEHTHLVKGLDYALLQKVRNEEREKEVDEAQEAKLRAKAMRKKQFKMPMGRSVYSSIFNPPRRDVSAAFLPRRMAFVYDMEEGSEYLDIPTTLHRSKDDCPKPVESILGVMDGAVLERLAKIMGFMHVAPGGKNGKRLKKRDKQRMLQGDMPPPPPLPSGANALNGQPATIGDVAQPAAPKSTPVDEEDDIFGGVGADYQLPETKSTAAGGKKESYFDRKDDMADLPAVPSGAAVQEGEVPPPPPEAPPPPPPPPADADMVPAMPPADYNYDYSAAYGAVPADAQQQWAQQAYQAGYDAYGQPIDPAYQAAMAGVVDAEEGPRELTTKEKEAGLGSVFKRDDERLAKLREQDEREKDPNFVSDAYAECYPAFHEFGTTVVDSDDEDLSHMDNKAKGVTRSEFTTEEEYQTAKAKQETLPKAAFQFGQKMADGRKTHKELLKHSGGKMKNELKDIKELLDKKGTKYGRAFEEEPDFSGAAPTPKRKRIV